MVGLAEAPPSHHSPDYGSGVKSKVFFYVWVYSMLINWKLSCSFNSKYNLHRQYWQKVKSFNEKKQFWNFMNFEWMVAISIFKNTA